MSFVVICVLAVTMAAETALELVVVLLGMSTVMFMQFYSDYRALINLGKGVK
jgi:hypothetical protein